MDLKRMQNLIQRHLNTRWRISLWFHNVSQAFSRIPGTCAMGTPHGAPWKCWCWTGAFADDVAQAWGKSLQAARQFLSDSGPQLLTGLHDMMHIWSQFDQEEQADAVGFLHSLWSFSGSTFFACRFFHRSERGHTEERERERESSSLSTSFSQMEKAPFLWTPWSTTGLMKQEDNSSMAHLVE